MTDSHTCIDADFLRGVSGIEIVPHAVRLLAMGRPVALAEIASAAGVPVEEVEELLRAQPGSDWDEGGRLVGFGLTQRPTAHNLILPTASLYTWCAMDTLLFALMLQTPATAVSKCPATGREIRVEVSPDAIRSVDPEEAVVSQVFASTVRDIRHELCDHGHFFASAEAADGWVRDHPDGAVLSIRDAFVQSQRAYEQMGWDAER